MEEEGWGGRYEETTTRTPLPPIYNRGHLMIHHHLHLCCRHRCLLLLLLCPRFLRSFWRRKGSRMGGRVYLEEEGEGGECVSFDTAL